MKKIIIPIILFLLSATNAYAANLYFETIRTGDESIYDVNILIDTEGELINAIEGEILIPSDSLKVLSMSDGNSAINFWLNKPAIATDKLMFSGITPGGFVGKDRLILSVKVKELSRKEGNISFGKLKILKNDSQGTEIMYRSSGLSLPINTELIKIVSDTQPPEDFEPSVFSNSDLFDGKKMLVFATQDKKSGVKGYMVKEGLIGKYIDASSPYELADQDADSVIYVKAIDNHNNERIVKFYPPNYRPLYLRFEIVAIILLVITFYIKRKKWLKFVK
jgi:hypothetical protein